MFSWSQLFWGLFFSRNFVLGFILELSLEKLQDFLGCGLVVSKAVDFTLEHDQLGRYARGGEHLVHKTALLERYGGIPVAMHKQKRRVIFGNVGDGADQSGRPTFWTDVRKVAFGSRSAQIVSAEAS